MFINIRKKTRIKNYSVGMHRKLPSGVNGHQKDYRPQYATDTKSASAKKWIVI